MVLPPKHNRQGIVLGNDSLEIPLVVYKLCFEMGIVNTK